MGKVSPFLLTNNTPVNRKCDTPKPFFFEPDFSSTILWYDEAGTPKKYVPTEQLENGEWMYALSPKRNEKPLRGIALIKHLHEITKIKEKKNEVL